MNWINSRPPKEIECTHGAFFLVCEFDCTGHPDIVETAEYDFTLGEWDLDRHGHMDRVDCWAQIELPKAV